MTELLDNALQLLCVTLCGLYSLFATVTKRNYKWLLVTLFYLSFGIGLAYWVLYLVLFNSSPRVFFVAELNWVASYIFLAMRLVLSLSGEERKMRSKPVFWLLPAFSLVMCVFFCFRSSYLENIFMGAAIAVCGFLAVKGLYLERRRGTHKKFYIFLAALFFYAAEYLLWISSYFAADGALFDPYLLTDTFILDPALIFVVIAQHQSEKDGEKTCPTT